MADERGHSRKRRIRKATPTVRSQIEDSSKAAQKPTKKRLGGLGKMFIIFRPLAPVARVLKKILGWLMPRYFINAWLELRKVSWPNRRETWRLTTAVFIFAVVFGALVAGVDKGLDEFFKKVILK